MPRRTVGLVADPGEWSRADGRPDVRDDVPVIHRLIHICVEKVPLSVERSRTSVDWPVGLKECFSNPLRVRSAAA